MRWFVPIIFRGFIGSCIAILLFLLTVFFILDEGADSVFQVYLAVFFPLGLGLIIGFAVPDVMSWFRWRHYWLPVAMGERMTDEYMREKVFKHGLRILIGPVTNSFVRKKRLNQYIELWASFCLRERMREEWCWELYELSWDNISHDATQIDTLRALLFDSEVVYENAFHLAMELYRIPGENYELALLLTKEGLERDDEQLNSFQLEILYHAYVTVYKIEEEALQKRILPFLLRRFLVNERRDHLAARIYIDAFKAGQVTQRLRQEMRNTARILLRSGQYMELSDEIQGLLGEVIQPMPLQESIAVRAKEESFSSLVFDQDKETIESNEKRFTINSFNPLKVSAPVLSKKGSGTVKKMKVTIVKILYQINPVLLIKNLFSRISIPPKILYAVSAIVGTIVIVSALIVFATNLTRNRTIELTPPGPYLSDKPLAVQIAARRTMEGAEELIDTLRSLNIDAYVVWREGSQWYRVRAGAFDTEQGAARYADSLVALEIIDEYYIARFEPGEVPE